jgi:hypothetical protein
MARNEALVLQSHFIHATCSPDDFDKHDFPAISALRSSIGFLGRVRTSYHVLVAAAVRLENFDDIVISVIRRRRDDSKASNSMTKVKNQESWTLTRLFGYLGKPLTDENVQILLGPGSKRTKWTKARLAQEYDKLKSVSWEVHAEMQLLPRFVCDVSTSTRILPYIGCSKYSCVLCWHFLDMFSGIKTRGCHGKLYNVWGLPSFGHCNLSDKHKITPAIKAIEVLMKQEILQNSTSALPQAKKSTVGSSSVRTEIPGSEQGTLSQRVLDYLLGQRMAAAFPSTGSR